MEDPFALEHLLRAGTLLLEVESELEEYVRFPAYNHEDWSSLADFLEARGLQLRSTSQNTKLDLDFLYKHEFVRATWRYVSTKLFVRVYLVPFDLPGVHGCLRHRDERKVLGPAREYLTSLLKRVDRCETAWNCHVANRSVVKPFIPSDPDVRTLSEIFEELPSPRVDALSFLAGANVRIRAAYKAALQWEAPPGMRPLFPYQRRTVARMLHQELDPGMAVDPLYIPISGVSDSKTFYLQPSTMELLCEPSMRTQVRGGILCEEMGTGKTCIVLALIMATKHQISEPEDAPWHAPERPILTPVALRHFVSPQFQAARSAARMESPQSGSLPTLAELLTHFICTSPEKVGPPEFQRFIEEQPHLYGPLTRNIPFYHVYEQIPDTRFSQRRGITIRGPRKLYLTSATLIIVPATLIVQWTSEINKMCDGGSLRVLELDTGVRARPMPSVLELASKYDIILMTHNRFTAEKPRCNPSTLYSWQHCECGDPLQGIRVPLCACQVSKSVSPLVQIRWKRLVVDEGHVCGLKNQLSILAEELSVERKWVVTGTPTRNLMGLSLGQTHESTVTGNTDEGSCSYPEQIRELDDVSSIDGSTAPSSPRSREISMDLDGDLSQPFPWNLCHPDYSPPLIDDPKPDSLKEMHVNTHTQPITPRRWTKMDRDDLNQLADMIEGFIGVPQFAHKTSTFREQVIKPLMAHDGPKFGATQIVAQVMGHVMFRHQIHIVEEEIPERLPALKEKTVALQFEPLGAKAYNVLQSVIAVNAVDSEREGLDYLFHPRNKRNLVKTIENLAQTMFWKTDPGLLDIDQAIIRSQEALKKACEKSRPASDIQLISECIQVQNDATQDKLWRDVMLHEENPFVICGLTPPLQNAWLKLSASPRDNGVSLLDPDRITKLRETLVRFPLISEERLVHCGFDVVAQEEENAIKHEQFMKRKKRKKGHHDPAPTNQIIRKEKSRAGSKEKFEEVNRELRWAVDQKERGLPVDVHWHIPAVNESLASRSAFTSLRIGNTLSSKVNYILRKVLKHAAREKFLIFSALPLSLWYLAEALQVMQVQYLEYTSTVGVKFRQQNAVTFETSNKFRVLLMELKLGARGLNLVTASRIIFCEPVWHGDVESQAIKRAHRIGQKNHRIKVSTLVMRGTFEEEMVTRRHVLKQKLEKLPAMEEDIGMRKFIQNPIFIGTENMAPHAFEVTGLDVPLLPAEKERAETEEIHVDAKVSEKTTPTKKRKMVHFD